MLKHTAALVRTCTSRSLCAVGSFAAFAIGPGAFAACPPTFVATSFQSMQGSPYTVVVGDFNHDGRKDLAAANFSSSDATVRFADPNNPGIYFGAIHIPLSFNPRGAAVADFNHDQIDDLAVVYNGGGPANTRLAIMISNGNGTFQTPALYPIASQPFQLRVADFNHDGNPDIANLCGCGSISILLGNANGTFQPYTSHASGTFWSGLAVADMNGDGALDLVLTTNLAPSGAGQVGVAFGVPPHSASFGPVNSHPTGWFSAWEAAVGHFNSDGTPDIVVTSRLNNRVNVMLNDGAGVFTAQPAPFSGVQPQDLVVADFNGDGVLDVAVANWGGSSVTVHAGNGSGGLASGIAFPVSANPNSITVADMNNDGKPDIITGDQTGGNASILLNATCFSIANLVGPGGSTCDSQLTADDVIAFLSGFFAQQPISDVARLGGAIGPDGLWTADDVVAFLSAFFAGCL
ncbi:MAG: FG-GAP-like repeat-containing protein [Phycisphaerales bacterium]